jgi:hypothetical protein
MRCPGCCIVNNVLPKPITNLKVMTNNGYAVGESLQTKTDGAIAVVIEINSAKRRACTAALLWGANTLKAED